MIARPLQALHYLNGVLGVRMRVCVYVALGRTVLGSALPVHEMPCLLATCSG